MKLLCLFLFLVVSATSGCSHFAGGGRQDRTYAKHLKKMRVERDKRRAQLAKAAPKLPSPDSMVPSEPQEMMEISEGPMAVQSDPDSQ